jgi:hypothetical protein
MKKKQLSSPISFLKPSLSFLLPFLMILLPAIILPFHETSAQTSNPEDTYIYSPNNIFYAYVEAGETVDILFTKVQYLSFTYERGIVVNVDGPGGISDSCEIASPANFGDTCSLNGLTSGTTGIWRFVVQPDVTGGTAWHNRYAWEISVDGGSGHIDGRVWSEFYQMQQSSDPAEDTDFTFWYMTDQGYLYQAIPLFLVNSTLAMVGRAAA